MNPISVIAEADIAPVIEKSSFYDQSKSNERISHSENVNPNVTSPMIAGIEKSAKRSNFRNPNQLPCSPTPMKKKRERRFVVVKKKSSRSEDASTAASVACGKCKQAIGKSKCLCMAYESLQASHEEFFKISCILDDDQADLGQESKVGNGDNFAKIKGNIEKRDDVNEAELSSEMKLKRIIDKMLEEARESVPEPGSGRVMHLVKAFEKLSLLKLADLKEHEVEDVNKGIKLAFPGLHELPNFSEMEVSSTSFSPSNFALTSESLGLDPGRSYSLDSSQGSFWTKSAGGGQRSRRNSNESSTTFTRRQLRRKQQKATSLKPFTLRTEQRGKSKEEEFLKKIQQMREEEEKLRIPIAQGLPWTTDEPECLVKPPVKENTRPVDLVLHTDIRAVERSEFDLQVAEKMGSIAQYQMEKDRQQKLSEEEEIRRLRKELVPKAHPMPYFDKPFIPRRSTKHPTIPKEPKFHVPQHKKIKCYTSLEDFYAQPQGTV